METAWVDSTKSPLGLLNGLIGVDGSELTIVNGGLIIGQTTKGFTLSGFTVNGPVDFYNNTGALTLTDLDISNPKGDGLIVTAHKGSVTLKNVSSHDNAGYGALIQNNTSVVAPVTITNPTNGVYMNIDAILVN